ncbi:restriction endonuclease subunit S [Enterococcus faecium]|uniref:restriction endonuclease subunit S n=1 Tax=Enterococcus faecium TaxID=1352 RepID=UPI002891424C|nr:restriction endonuclease subunit S [Enterococcus faecium]MDT2363270.1 restriction endonuclease subunit S [Enterococcus faecium]
MSNNTQPEIRFPGFMEDWEQRKLGELAESFEYGLNASAKKFDGSNKYIRITDIDDISHKFNQSGVTSPDIDFASADNYKLKKGDILFARTGASVGKTYMYRESDGLVYYAGFLIRARIKSKISSEFVFQTTFTDSYNRFIKITSQRSGQPGVNAEEYSNFKIMIPNYEEQNAIGCFFKKIDDTITLHQRKLDLLKETKKGFLQKMFPKNGAKVPEIRFPGFTEDWEQRKLGEVSPLRGGFAFKSNKFVKEGIPIVRISNILSNGSVGGEFVYYTAQEKDENYLLPDKSALLAMSGATTGKVSILNNPNNNKVYQNQRVGYFTKTKNVDYSFISTLVRSKIFLDQLNSVLVAGAQPNISSKDINVFELTIPKNIEEQKKIGNFFKQLDDTIALHQRKLDLLKETKKGFLQKMFV